MTPFYDGHCGLCHRIVRFVIQHDREQVFRFAPLQGETASKQLPRDLPDSVVVEMLATYHREIAPVMVSVAADEHFADGLAQCSAALLVFYLSIRLAGAVESNPVFDLFNERQRLTTVLRNFIQLPGASRVTPHLRRWMVRVLAAVEAAWPEQIAPPELYPAFQV